jgi:hypothetical protein
VISVKNRIVRERSAVPQKVYLLRQAAMLLKFAQETSNPEMASVLVDKAADLNAKVDELTVFRSDVSPRAPDVEPDA